MATPMHWNLTVGQKMADLCQKDCKMPYSAVFFLIICIYLDIGPCWGQKITFNLLKSGIFVLRGPKGIAFALRQRDPMEMGNYGTP